MHLTQRYPETRVKSKAAQASTLAVPKERVKHTPVAPRDKEIMFLHAELDQVQPQTLRLKVQPPKWVRGCKATTRITRIRGTGQVPGQQAPQVGEQGLPQIPKTDLPSYMKLQSPWGTGWPGRKPCKLFWSLLYACTQDISPVRNQNSWS